MSDKKPKPGSLAKWTSDYIKANQRQNAGRSLTPAQQAILDLSTPTTKFKTTPPPDLQAMRDDTFGFQNVLDVLARPLYATANFAKETSKSINHITNPDEVPEAGMAPWDAIGRGLAGKDKTTFADVIGENIKPGHLEGGITGGTKEDHWGPSVKQIAMGAGGLTLDVALDPVNVIAGGAASAARAIKNAKSVSKAAKIPEETAAKLLEANKPKPAEYESYTSPRAQEHLDYMKAHPEDFPPLPDKTPAWKEPDDRNILSSVTGFEGKRTWDTPEQAALVSEGKLTEEAVPKAAAPIEPDELVNPFSAENQKLLNDVANLQNKAKIAESNKKIDDAAIVAQTHAPETVAPLAVQNIPRTVAETPRLDSVAMGKLGEQFTKSALSDFEKARVANGGQHIHGPGRPRAQALSAAVRQPWKASVEAEIAKGARPSITAMDGTEYAISTPHALDYLPSRDVENILYGGDWPRHKANTNLYNSQVDMGIAESLRLDDLGIPVADRYHIVEMAIQGAKHSSAKRVIPEASIQQAAKVFVDNTEALRQSQFDLAKTFVKKDIEDAGGMAQAKSSEIVDALTDPAAPTSRGIKAVVSVGSDLRRAAKEAGASDNAASLAAKETGQLAAKVASESDTAAAKSAMAVRNTRAKQGFTPAANKKIQDKIYRTAPIIERDAEALARHFGVDVNISNRVALHTEGFVQHAMKVFKAAFTLGHGTEGLAGVYRSGIGSADYSNHFFHSALNKYSKSLPGGRPAASVEFAKVQRGEAADPTMTGFINEVFDTEDALLGPLWRNGWGIDEINKAFKESGLGKYQFSNKPGSSPHDIANQWKSWDITDKLDFLARAHDSLAKLSAKHGAGMAMSRLGKVDKFPDAVKITADKDSVMGNFVNKDLWYDRPTAEAFSRFEHYMKQPVNFQGQKGKIAWLVNNVVDPFLQLWKPLVTILRPGFHIRNFLGEGFMTAMAGRASLTSLKRSMNMLASGGRLSKEGLEGVRALKSGELRAGHDTMTTVKLRGKNQKLTYENGFMLAHQHGLLETYRVQEDLADATHKGIKAFQRSLPMRIGGMGSEWTSHSWRLAHFENMLSDVRFTRKFGTLDEAAAKAAEEVRRFHPDVNGLNPGEKRVLKRLFPFYSWIKQAFPVVMMTAVTHPGRVTALPKATYNAAIAAGMEPDSLTDQFPTDKLYPSFVREAIAGPIGGYSYGLGSGQEAAADLINGNPVRNVAAMLNPLIKSPVELTTNTSIGTGAYQDKSEGLDSALPGGNTISGISGYSATGTAGNLLTALTGGKTTEILDQQRAMQRGEKEAFFNTNLLNFMVGLGINNVEKPSYRRIASKEQQ